MSRNGFRVLDSDLHVIEPRDLYERYLDPRYKARAPRPLDARQAYVSNWIVDGYGFPRPIGRGRPDAEARANAVLKDYAAAGFDSASQVKAMDVEGLDVLPPQEVLRVPPAGGLLQHPDRDLVQLSRRHGWNASRPEDLLDALGHLVGRLEAALATVAQDRLHEAAHHRPR